MKKKYSITLFSVMMALAYSVLTYAATGPAYPEVPVSERTSNLAENQNFVDIWSLRNTNSSNEVWINYDMYGNPLSNARLAGGVTYTDKNGYDIKTVSSSERLNYGWRQDPEKPINENGVSNWYYGNDIVPFGMAEWRWLPDQDNIKSTKKAYCFNEYGYLYVNTITPDGFLVNERGQMIARDGTLVEHEEDALTHSPMRGGYVGAPIGFMKQKYFTVCDWTIGYEGNPACMGKCLFGYDK